MASARGPTDERSANLLNLLKFSGSGTSAAAAAAAAAASQARDSPSPDDIDHRHARPLMHHSHVAYSPSPPSSPPRHTTIRQQQRQNLLQQFQSDGGSGAEHHHRPYVVDMAPDPPSAPHIVAPAPSAGDPSGLLRDLMRGDREAEEAPSVDPIIINASPSGQFRRGSPGPDTREMLLNLLNRPKPNQGAQQNEQPLLVEAGSTSFTPGSHEGEGGRHGSLQMSQIGQPAFGGGYSSYGYEPRPPQQNVDSYGYQQSPQGRERSVDSFGFGTMRSGRSDENKAPADPVGQFQILKKSQQPSPATSVEKPYSKEHSPRVVSRKPESLASPSHNNVVERTPGTSEDSAFVHANKEAVSEAVSDLAEQASREAAAAITRAEEGSHQEDMERKLIDMIKADDDSFDDAATGAAKAVKRELDRDENSGALEASLEPGVAKTVRDIVDETAVADNWESAEQDEIIVVEEDQPRPIKVYNFPMKPWISITLVEGAADPRPLFGDKTVLNVAKLKKDFDQMDRNLYAATEHFMAYGMSKAGGFRVICQEDGRDAKVFGATKDRIFNVAMSVTPADHEGVHKEAVIGTGVSGTVYWVQVMEGDSDFILDPSIEQHGFALPPGGTQEGDTPGGALKTRARTSSFHPEYFAVGRGKTISIVWPQFVMRNAMFKPGHDRVVDTDKLARHCSLRINTGKAGKDFSFSQDDSVIVSLDKSGRVKFWDVRDLTACSEDSDPRFPVPAHDSMELSEPIMTLATTPEGEKAWPTSVLLLDKPKPYQKRCALRYLIVGMKQNHTIQLWDLALSKAVQEFNLPHSKESDAVCSVMYHAATGMLVIGHPTRNSIYFAHLSAPKYNLKGTSQAEYMQKVQAMDPSVPQPDATAVISGVREFSFANQGILRSLDILSNPGASHEEDEAALFELYAMHSKGVACLRIKQADLGWKDNKVIEPVDAVEAGVVTVGALKPVPADQPPQNSDESLPVAPRAANRGGAKEPLLQTPEAAVQKGPESVSPVKLKPKEKEPEAAPAGGPGSEKAESNKRRKKKAPAASEGTTNGTSPHPANSAAKHPDPKVSSSAGSSLTFSMPPALDAGSTEVIEAAMNTMESRLGDRLRDFFAAVDENSRARDSNFEERQRQLLSRVSDVLNENTQTVLQSMIQQEFTNTVVPTVSRVAGQAVKNELNEKLNGQIVHAVKSEMHQSLPALLQHALQGSNLGSSVADRVQAAISEPLQQTLLARLMNGLSPVISDAAHQACRHVADASRHQLQAEVEGLRQRRAEDAAKMDQLTAMVSTLSATISALASGQAQVQDGMHKLQAQLTQRDGDATRDRERAPSNNASQAGSDRNNRPGHDLYETSAWSPSRSQALVHAGPPRHTEQMNAALSYMNRTQPTHSNPFARTCDRILELLNSHNHEKALVCWIQSGDEQVVFDEFMHRISPAFMQSSTIPPLVLLSVASTVSTELTGKRIGQRIAWMECSISVLYEALARNDLGVANDHQLANVMPKVVHIIVQRVEGLFAEISKQSPMDPVLQTLSKILDKAKGIRTLASHQ